MEEGGRNPGMGSKAQVEGWGFHKKREETGENEGQENTAVETCRDLRGNCRRLGLLSYISLWSRKQCHVRRAHVCLCPEGCPIPFGSLWRMATCETHQVISLCVRPRCLWSSPGIHPFLFWGVPPPQLLAILWIHGTHLCFLFLRQVAEHGEWLRLVMVETDCLGSYPSSALYLLHNLGWVT